MLYVDITEMCFIPSREYIVLYIWVSGVFWGCLANVSVSVKLIFQSFIQYWQADMK